MHYLIKKQIFAQPILKLGGLCMKDNINHGVRCNVEDCVYNEKGCDCNRSVIEVSKDARGETPDGEAHHFCKSFICKRDDKPDCNENCPHNLC